MLHHKAFIDKPSATETGSIQNNMVIQEITVETLAKEIVKGRTCRPAVMIGAKDSDWIQQQIFMVDIDGGLSIQDAITKYKHLNPAFIYTSFSHTETKHKFRLVFVTDKPITDKDEAKGIIESLIKHIPESDTSCRNLGRVYYGGKDIVYEDYDAKLKLDTSEPIDMTIVEEKGEQVYISNNNSIIPVPPKTQSLCSIRDRAIDDIKVELNLPEKICINNEEYMRYITSINLAHILGVPEDKSFNCLLHEDKNPSANIFKTEQGVYIYKCFSEKCKASYNIVCVLEAIFGFTSRHKTHEFIRHILNVKIEYNEWQLSQLQNMEHNIYFLLYELRDTDSNLYNTLRYNLGYITNLHQFAKNNVLDVGFSIDKLKRGSKDGNVYFMATMKDLCRLAGLSTKSGSKLVVKNGLLQYHGLLIKMIDDDIPKEVLDSANKRRALREGTSNRVNFWEIPSYTVSVIQHMISQNVKWRDNGYVAKSFCREMVYRKEGEGVANMLFPQNKYTRKNGVLVNRGCSEKHDEIQKEIVGIMEDLLSVQGYFSKSDVIVRMGMNTIDEASRLLGIHLPEMVDKYGYTKIRCNKEVKSKYNVISEGYPVIYVRE